MTVEIDLSWLAGIIDGEGCASLKKSQNKSGGPKYTPALRVGMTHQPTIRRAYEILETISVTGCQEYRSPGRDGRQRSFNLTITMLSEIKTVCDAVLPYSLTKSRQLSLLSEYCTKRLALHDLREDGTAISKRGSAPYDDRDHQIYVELKHLNARGSDRDPIDNIEWIHARKLTANNYNPSVVFTPELKLLEACILDFGWIQPILVTEALEIIDGFHRWRLSLDSEALKQRYAEEVPICILPLDRPQAMMLTIQMNRAKGTHVAVRMSDVIQELHNDLGISIDDIREGCGMQRQEVELLLAGHLLKTRDLKNYRYSRAWVPIETRHAQKIVEEYEREG